MTIQQIVNILIMNNVALLLCVIGLVLSAITIVRLLNRVKALRSEIQDYEHFPQINVVGFMDEDGEIEYIEEDKAA